MKSQIKYSILGLSLSSAMILSAGNILTPQANEDYLKRLEAQPEIAESLAMPKNLSPDETEALKFL